VAPHGFVVAFAPFGEAAADRVAQQLERGNAFLDTGVPALGQHALLFGCRVGFADAVAAGRLNLAGESANVAFELHQLVVMIGECLFEALAAQLAPQLRFHTRFWWIRTTSWLPGVSPRCWLYHRRLGTLRHSRPSASFPSVGNNTSTNPASSIVSR
jgi:hypothetical protein